MKPSRKYSGGYEPAAETGAENAIVRNAVGIGRQFSRATLDFPGDSDRGAGAMYIKYRGENVDAENAALW